VNDEFYVGYLQKSPPGLATRTRAWIVMVGVITAVVAGLVAARQTPAEVGLFEFGVGRTFEGVLHEFPIPILRTVSPDGSVTNHLLVGPGKQGLPPFARGSDGQHVRFVGSLIQMGSNRMIEVNDEASFVRIGPANTANPRPPQIEIGQVVLRGELVDTKCYFGVMRPATGKVHRACAVRCLSGGVPPGLLVRDGQGNAVVVLLCGRNGTPLKLDAQWAARVMDVHGRLLVREGVASLEVEHITLVDGPES